MNRFIRCLSAAVLAGAIAITPAAGIADMNPLTVYAHGHHQDSHHSSSSTSYYYCGGHSAHTHKYGVCPYASNYYYCNGHAAHRHTNGVCPYSSSVSKSTIKKVQKKLNKCGYNCGTADGVIGAKTIKALKKFQKANGIKADGVIRQTTLKALGL